jgi:hypothetical protein
VERRTTARSASAVALGVLMYPFIILGTLLAYFAYRGKNAHVDEAQRRAILWDRVKLNLSPQTLFGKHIFWVLRKDKDVADRIAELKAFTQ